MRTFVLVSHKLQSGYNFQLTFQVSWFLCHWEHRRNQWRLPDPAESLSRQTKQFGKTPLVNDQIYRIV